MKSGVSAKLRRRVRERAKFRCEYCLLPEEFSAAPLEQDHIVARKHDGKSVLDNLALACFACNGFKGTDLTSVDEKSGQLVRLFNPRRDVWSQHFKVTAGRIVPLTAIGRVTVKLLQMNADGNVAQRLWLAERGLYN